MDSANWDNGFTVMDRFKQALFDTALEPHPTSQSFDKFFSVDKRRPQVKSYRILRSMYRSTNDGHVSPAANPVNRAVEAFFALLSPPRLLRCQYRYYQMEMNPAGARDPTL